MTADDRTPEVAAVPDAPAEPDEQVEASSADDAAEGAGPAEATGATDRGLAGAGTTGAEATTAAPRRRASRRAAPAPGAVGGDATGPGAVTAGVAPSAGDAQVDPALANLLDDEPAFEFEESGPGDASNSAVRRPSRAGPRRRRYEDETPDDSAAVAARQAEMIAVELRLAHLHLRTGSYDLARIQLETLVGKGRLNERGLVDLAESRWRLGDLTGAADAVDAYLAAGGEAPIGFVIAAEARSAEGRPSDARRYAREAMERLTMPLDVLFAGQPRSSVWPHDPAEPAPTTATLFAAAAATPAQGGRIGLADRRPPETAPSSTVGSADRSRGASPVGAATVGAAGFAVAGGSTGGQAYADEDAVEDDQSGGARQGGAGFWDDDPGLAGSPGAVAAVAMAGGRAGSSVPPVSGADSDRGPAATVDPAPGQLPIPIAAAGPGATAVAGPAPFNAAVRPEPSSVPAPDFIVGARVLDDEDGDLEAADTYEPPEPTWLMYGARRTTESATASASPPQRGETAGTTSPPPVGLGTPAGATAGAGRAATGESSEGASSRAATPPPLPDAHVELERARDALRDGDGRTAAMRLSMVLRLQPSLAPIVLDLAGDEPGQDFDFVRGDAFRLVGQESAAQRAYAAAMGTTGGATAPVGASAPESTLTDRSARPTRPTRPIRPPSHQPSSDRSDSVPPADGGPSNASSNP